MPQAEFHVTLTFKYPGSEWFAEYGGRFDSYDEIGPAAAKAAKREEERRNATAAGTAGPMRIRITEN